MKHEFCGGQDSRWQLPCTVGRMPQGPSPCSLDGSAGMSIWKCSLSSFWAFPPLPRLHLWQPHRDICCCSWYC